MTGETLCQVFELFKTKFKVTNTQLFAKQLSCKKFIFFYLHTILKPNFTEIIQFKNYDHIINNIKMNLCNIKFKFFRIKEFSNFIIFNWL